MIIKEENGILIFKRRRLSEIVSNFLGKDDCTERQVIDIGSYFNKREYEQFVEQHNNGSFLQSINWSKVKGNWECEHAIVRDDNGKILAVMQILIKKIPCLHTAYMYAPRGPVCDYYDEELLKKLMVEVERIQKKYNAFAIKTDPLILEGDRLAISNMKKAGFEYLIEKDGYDTIQCRSNYILNVEGKTEEDVYNGFHKKWRYNIRLAIKKGVKCASYGLEKINDFYDLMLETGKRDGFEVREKEYYINILRRLGEKARLYICYYDNIPLSGAIAINYGKKVHYLYGASTSTHREVMTNYLMQWTMIKWAIQTKCKVYDFMGIPFYYDVNHSNYGVYKFKKGFNGNVINYAGEFQHIYHPLCGRFIIKTMNFAGYKI